MTAHEATPSTRPQMEPTPGARRPSLRSHSDAGHRAWVPWVLATLMVCGATATSHASEGWQWLDETGRKVFSDTPPPSSVPERRIVKRPGVAPGPLVVTPVAQGTPPPAPARAATPGTATAEAKGGAAAKAVRVDTEAERQAQEQRNAATRADNCQRARSSLLTLESGARLMVSNPQGEQVPMDEPTRSAEIARVQQAMRDNCR